MAKELSAIALGLKARTAAYIPAEGRGTLGEYRDFQRALKGPGFRRFRRVAIDRPLSPRAEAALFACDAIFLGGGNTFAFLKSLRERGLIPKLRAFAKRGGILLGLSAGSILLTPKIATAEVPSLDKDNNEVGLRNLAALGLVRFEFSPHYSRSVRADRELLRYSRRLSHPVYACADGEGIVVRNGRIRLIGNVKAFYRGRKITLGNRATVSDVKSSPNAASRHLL